MSIKSSESGRAVRSEKTNKNPSCTGKGSSRSMYKMLKIPCKQMTVPRKALTGPQKRHHLLLVTKNWCVRALGRNSMGKCLER